MILGSPMNNQGKMSKTTVMAVLLTFLLVSITIFAGAFTIAGERKQPGPRVYTKAAVAADAGPCSEVGRDILMEGGSAVDAAIATLLCIGIMNPHSAGIGGGGFFTIYDASTGKAENIISREVAPRLAKANTTMTWNETLASLDGPLSIGVPGELRGYELAHKRHGKLPWKDLFQPSIRFAEEGFPVGRPLADNLNLSRDVIITIPSLCEVFCGKDGDILKENDTIKFPTLAQTYRTIAEEGADAFYTGELAQNFINDLQAEGSILTMEDLRDYKVVLNENPITAYLGEYKFMVPTVPAGGPVMALIVNMLNGFTWNKANVSTTDNMILTYHRLIETFRFGYAKRSYLGDPRFINVTDYIKTMTSKSFADELREKITDDSTHGSEYYGGLENLPEDRGTTHVSVLAEDGSAVAVTTSINWTFGAKMMSRSTGIMPNNQLADFSTQYRAVDNSLPLPGNMMEAGKRPYSTQCPTIIFDKNNKVKMVVGASGAIKITTAVAQVILNTLFFDYDLEKAVRFPRIHHQFSPNTTLFEPNFDPAIKDALAAKNHQTKWGPKPLATVQAVVRKEDGIHAKSDERKFSYAAGY